MTNYLNRATTNPETNPQWFTQGITHLLPKSNKTNIPKNFTSINCLSTMYKTLTSITTERTYDFLNRNNNLPSKQKGYKKILWLQRPVFDNKMFLENSHSCHRTLNTGWIDYRKAFNSIPYTQILKVVQMYKIFPTILNFLLTSINKWKTNLYVHHSQGSTICEKIKIKCEIFQAKSLSPLSFSLALVTLSYEFNNMRYVYNIYREKINHLFYKDDLKLYVKNEQKTKKTKKQKRHLVMT